MKMQMTSETSGSNWAPLGWTGVSSFSLKRSKERPGVIFHVNTHLRRGAESLHTPLSPHSVLYGLTVFLSLHAITGLDGIRYNTAQG